MQRNRESMEKDKESVLKDRESLKKECMEKECRENSDIPVSERRVRDKKGIKDI